MGGRGLYGTQERARVDANPHDQQDHGHEEGDLTPRERTVFELRHYQGLRLRAIGEMLGTSEEAAKNCLFRATQKMRVVLGDLV